MFNDEIQNSIQGNLIFLFDNYLIHENTFTHVVPNFHRTMEIIDCYLITIHIRTIFLKCVELFHLVL